MTRTNDEQEFRAGEFSYIDVIEAERRARQLRAEAIAAGARSFRAWVSAKWAGLRGNAANQAA